MIRIGFIGVNHGHEGVFLDLFNGNHRHEGFPLLREAKVVGISGFEQFETWKELGKQYSLKVVSPKASDVIEQCDGVMVLSYDYSYAENYVDYHVELAIAALEAGKPTFVDKPMANQMKNIQTMFHRSAQLGVPLLCASSMRTDPALTYVRDHLSDVGQVRFARCTLTNGTLIGYGIHGAEMIQEVFGQGIKRIKAEAHGAVNIVHVDYGDDKAVILEHFPCQKYIKQLQVFGTEGALDSQNLEPVYPRVHYEFLLSEYIQMVKEKKSPVKKEDTIESHGIVIGAELSLKERRVVELATF
ncbi:Gfo/Idh/MocA family oxidoreductase [Candidatus Poribacteria bacterium]|nr:Gfo/Idh/MocA family oxidoreductase [Candidatus Poribacteria bacterium]